MRCALVVAIVLALGNTGSSALQVPQPDLWITVEPSRGPGGQASVRAMNAQMYIEGPVAWIGVPGQETSADPVIFSIRAWREGAKARVVVYARLNDLRAPGGITETPIATFLLAAKETVHVPKAEKWGGPRLAVSAALQ